MKVSQLPNLITVSRIALAPVLILLLKDQQYAAALAVFLVAGASDALDGWIAKRFKLVTRLGSILDPLADKILLVSSYVMLTVLDQLPFWLTLSVVFRDLLIVSGYLAYTSMVGPVKMSPSNLSKLNTLMQIALIFALLVQLAVPLSYPLLTEALFYIVFITTVASGVHYVWVWGFVKIKKVEKASARGGVRG